MTKAAIHATRCVAFDQEYFFAVAVGLEVGGGLGWLWNDGLGFFKK